MQLMRNLDLNILAAAAFILLADQSALGCSCVAVQPFCNALPNAATKQTAIFVGVVKSVYPAETMQDYARALFPDVPISAGSTPGIEHLRTSLLRLWHGVLSPEEERQLRDAKSEKDLQTPLKGLFWSLPRRVQLEVTERFTGPSGDTFELFTGIGAGDCGVGFKPGESFLVVAGQDSVTGRWSSTICSRTQLSRYAEADLAALRAWKKGEALKPTVYGTVQDWTNRGNGWGVGSKPLANLKLRLRSGQEEHTAITNVDGQFSFPG
jgi:hypothetical protein